MKPPATQTKPPGSAGSAGSRVYNAQPENRPAMRELYHRAKTQFQKLRKHQGPGSGNSRLEADTQRLVQELQVHQIELEMQNAELEEARARQEVLLEKYTDLYDFAPVGYMSLDEQGHILEVNLTGAALLGVGRSLLINRRLPAHVALAGRSRFLAFINQIFAGAGKQVCETTLLREGGAPFWANIHGTAATSASGSQKCCRVVISDITALKQSEEAQRRLGALADANRELRQEIVRRQGVEASLKKSERDLSQLLAQSGVMQNQLRRLSRQIISAQEDERKMISRELHDVIAQTLTGINIQLAALAKETRTNPKEFDRNIARTRRLVEHSVEIVHDFARELRPAVLDDLGLVPALHTFMRSFARRTGVHASLKAFAGLEQLDTVKRTVLFRIAQEALTNVARHAQASRVEVSIRELPDCICMRIKDDGKAFEVERVLHGKGSKRLGLLGMRERLEMVGGKFTVESSPGKGTTVRAQIPPGKVARGGTLMESAEIKN
jgi:PAS domain S-box-containing protein